MKTKLTTLIMACGLLFTGAVGAQTPCSNDLNGFVSYKNTGGTGSYQLSIGSEERAAQTYNYAGPGKVAGVRIYGSYPVSGFGGVPLRIGIYNVDLSGRPTTSVATVNDIWWGFAYNTTGYMNVTFPGGVTVSNRFAVTVEIRDNVFPNGTVFNLRYTGNGEGGNQDLASLAGTSTGFNWASAKNSFSKDGDFYLVPAMAQLNNPGFTTSASCYAANASVLFTNTSQLTQDSMFNKIAFPNYSGSNYIYTWNFGDATPVSHAANPSHTYVSGGVYTVTLTTTIEGWNSSACVRTYTKALSVGLSVSGGAIANASCYGASNGSFTASGQFGAPSYSYSINNSVWQTGSAFTGLNAGAYTLYVKDSKGCTNSTNLTITQPTGIALTNILTTNASCGNSNGGITLSASGGIAPLQYKLDNGSFQANGNFTSLAPQMHTLIVSDANGCTTTSLVVVNDLGGPVMGNINITNVSCYNGNDGSITLSSSGGTGGMQYSINGGTTYQASPVFAAVSAGTYVCIVKDNATCTDIAIVTIGQGQPLGLTLSSLPAVCSSAANGAIMATSTGGTGSHNYSLNGINYQSGSTFPGLAAGTYTVYVKDVTGCVKTATIAVAQPPALALTLTPTAASCNGLSDGAITASGSGGNGNLVYSMNGMDFQSSGSFMYLPAGTYTLWLKDMYACSASSTITITQPSAITTTVNTTNSTCTFTNGAIMVLAGGSSGSGYQFSINGGASFSNSGLFSSLAAGTQYVVVKDGLGCQTVVSGTILDSNGPSITSSSQQNVSCNGGSDGSITINSVTGGTGQLLYSKNGINWQTSAVFSSLTAGTYIIQVKDANGCIGSVTKVITQPNGFLIAPTTSSLACYGGTNGSATITASGGAGFLVYSINGGATYQSGNIFNNLVAGNYNVKVKDAANCIANSLFAIVQPIELKLNSLGTLNVTCNGSNDGAIFVAATGGFTPYQYNINFGSYLSSPSFTGLSGNTYYISVKDAHNCVVSTLVNISEPDPIAVTPIINEIKCAGGNNGAISLNVTGGVSPYGFLWSNGSYMSSVFNLSAGNYSVTVTDYNGCSSQKTYTLSQPANPLVSNGVVTPASSTNPGDGSIDVTISGGVGPYTFNWSNGATTEDISNLIPGTYMLTITDANGCTTSSTFIVGNITGISSVQISPSSINVYPNPTAEDATVKAQGYKISKIEVENVIGQIVFKDTVQDEKATIRTAELANGTYFIKVYVNENVVIKRFIVNR